MPDYESKPSRWIFRDGGSPLFSLQNIMTYIRGEYPRPSHFKSLVKHPPPPNFASPLIFYFDLTANESNPLIRAGGRRQG